MKGAFLATLLGTLMLTGCSGEQEKSDLITYNIAQQSFEKFTEMESELKQQRKAEELEKQRLEKIRAEEEEKKNKRPVYNIPLSEDLKDFIWKQSNKYNIEYETVLALIRTESNFDPKAISHNFSSRGLGQLNSNTYPWIARELGIHNFDVYNPYHNIEASIWYLNYLKQRWIDKGYSDKEAMRRSLLSYHRGETGARRYIQANGTSRSSYTNKIYDYKNKIIKGSVK